jgi:site-specific DNA recombinase
MKTSDTSRPRAAIYVRVSSTGQLGRDGDADGYSIPAQVQACERKAADLDAGVARAYIERAESARSAHRPVLQQMLAEMPELGVRYLIVHKVDRLAGNRLDDAVLYEQLVGMGVALVSASENIDETPTGRLMHGMLATYAEYYSNNLASEIKKGLTQKHLTGGTPFKPPIGYMPKRELIGNQDVRSVVTDPQRAPLVTLAFDLYATGDWPLHRLTAHLEDLGLTSRPTPSRPAKPLRATSVHKLLTNPYYCGIVEYQGRRVVGRHDQLVDRDTFDRVRAQLAARRNASDRPSKHEHYLRGSLFCADCGGRLLYTQNTGNGGTYEYFSCINRVSRHGGKGHCQGPHYSADKIAAALEEHYRSVRLKPAKQREIVGDVRADAEERTAIVLRDVAGHRRALESLEAQQAHLVELSFRGLVSDAVLARKQKELEVEQARVSDLLAKAQQHADDIEAELAEILDRTKTPHATYLAGTPLERRILNQIFFKRILVGEDAEILGVSLTPAYAAVAAWQPSFGQPRPTLREGRRTVQEAGTAVQGAESTNPGPLLRDQGLNFLQMVETAGIEPASADA